jgi:hypothetical protein
MTVADSEFYQALGRLEGKMDIIVGALPALESRVRVLENWRWKVVGAAAVAAGLVAFVVDRVVR